jgi:multidrug resistance efflux pump
MLLGFVLLFLCAAVIWLVFFKFKWLTFSIAWGVVCSLFVAHLLLIFMIGLRFATPYATDARVIQHTIQLTPRLSEPTLVTAVLVQPNEHVVQGTPLFQFDRRPYNAKVKQLEAQLAQAKQDVLILKQDVEVSAQKVVKLLAELEYARYEEKLSLDLARQGAGPQEDAQKWTAQVAADEAGIKEAQAEQRRAELRYQSEIGGVNTSVAAIQAELDLARFYLANTLMVAPEDGYILNLQVRPGMVAGDIRFGAIASFICDADRYLLADFFQENLKFVKPGQSAEVALDLYPGQIWKGRVEAIWQGSGVGQLLPSGTVPDFAYVPAQLPQGEFAVAIRLEDSDQSKFPIGTQGRATIYAQPKSPFVVLRRIGIRAYSWFNWLYPFSG